MRMDLCALVQLMREIKIEREGSRQKGGGARGGGEAERDKEKWEGRAL